MCRQVMCIACEKPSWAGCGAHIEQVLADVPFDQRCRCREDAPVSVRGAQPPSSRRNPDFGKRVSMTPSPPEVAPQARQASPPPSTPSDESGSESQRKPWWKPW